MFAPTYVHTRACKYAKTYAARVNHKIQYLLIKYNNISDTIIQKAIAFTYLKQYLDLNRTIEAEDALWMHRFYSEITEMIELEIGTHVIRRVVN